jgi:hypothetical protein
MEQVLTDSAHIHTQVDREGKEATYSAEQREEVFGGADHAQVVDF